ncbi:MAG: transposase, partial [Myxococcales bacterium]|nr:transposase [Myxococcales bacterium]
MKATRPAACARATFQVDFAVEVVASKWGLHLPHTRQAAEMALDGLALSDAQLCQISEQFARVLGHTYEQLGEWVAASELFHADETRWPMLANGRMKWWMWAFSNYDSVFIVIDKTRGHEVPKAFFEDSKGVVVVDGYAAYGKVVKLNSNLCLAWCWSHARRKFVDAEKAYPVATEMTDMMRDLFMIDRELPD